MERFQTVSSTPFIPNPCPGSCLALCEWIHHQRSNFEYNSTLQLKLWMSLGERKLIIILIFKENDKVRLLRVQNNSSTKHHSKVLHAVAEHVAAGKKLHTQIQNLYRVQCVLWFLILLAYRRPSIMLSTDWVGKCQNLQFYSQLLTSCQPAAPSLNLSPTPKISSSRGELCEDFSCTGMIPSRCFCGGCYWRVSFESTTRYSFIGCIHHVHT